MKFVSLTRHNKEKIWFKPESVTLFYEDDFHGGKTSIRIDGETYGVMETVEEIRSLLQAC